VTPYEPKSPLAEKLLLDFWFSPFRGGHLVTDNILGHVEATAEEIEAVLQAFETDGLVTGHVLAGLRDRAYAPTRLAWEIRERLLRERGLRHPALIRQREQNPRDLVVALIVSGHTENDRLTGAFLAGDPKKTMEELTIYLADFTLAEIEETCSALVTDGLIAKGRKYDPQGDKDGYDITGRGRVEYKTHVAPRLRLADGESILDPAVGDHIEVFDAWQSEFTRSRNVIWDVLPVVVAEINQMAGLVRPLRVIQATSPGDGAIRIDVALQDRIRKAEFFVGDVTPVYAYGDRLRMNENVLVEMGFALGSKEPNQIILLAMRRTDVPGEAQSNPQRAFDIAHVRRHEFTDKNDLRRRLRVELEAALRARGWLPRVS
jgi:hypothetical protein